MVFRPIAFKTQLGQARYYLFGPFCYLNKGCNPKIAKVTSVLSRVRARSGTVSQSSYVEANSYIARIPECILYLEEPNRLPSSTRINSFVCLAVWPSVHACRLGIERKMVHAQQIRPIILQNHEST